MVTVLQTGCCQALPVLRARLGCMQLPVSVGSLGAGCLSSLSPLIGRLGCSHLPVAVLARRLCQCSQTLLLRWDMTRNRRLKGGLLAVHFATDRQKSCCSPALQAAIDQLTCRPQGLPLGSASAGLCPSALPVELGQAVRHLFTWTWVNGTPECCLLTLPLAAGKLACCLLSLPLAAALGSSQGNIGLSGFTS